MSWFFCSWDPGDLNNVFDEIHDFTDNIFVTDEMYIAVGDTGFTHYSEFNLESKVGWVVCGVGIKHEGDEYNIMNFNDWQRVINNGDTNLKSIDGHYAILKFDENKIELFTDKLGLRDIYYGNNGKRYYCSTRIDWIAKCINTEIDFNIFSTRWLLVNQMSKKSFLRGITRVVGTDRVVISEGGVKTSQENIDFLTEGKYDANNFQNKITGIINAGFKTGQKVSLSLSGGLDSRVLLSMLLSKNSEQWNCHTFGNPNSPDSKVVEKIVNKLSLEHIQYYSSISETDHAINLISDYAEGSLITNPISTALQMRYYEELKDNQHVVIDGGFGEIWRREFLNRLSFFGKKIVLGRDFNSMYPYMLLFKADVFTEDIENKMRGNCISQLENIFNELPGMEELGFENWIDLFAIKTRLINYYSHEQNRIDNMLLSYMPFAQESILKKIFLVDINQKINGKLFRKIIKKNKKELTRFSLAKNDLIYPYSFGSIASRMYSKINRRLKKNYTENDRDHLLKILREYILDLINSNEVKNYSPYDKNKLNVLEKEFAKGNEKYYDQIDWWLSFELFRQSITNKS